MTENSDRCAIGQNGCFTVQELQKTCVKAEADTIQNAKDIGFLLRTTDEIKALLWKYTLGIAILTTLIQSIFKFVPMVK